MSEGGGVGERRRANGDANGRGVVVRERAVRVRVRDGGTPPLSRMPSAAPTPPPTITAVGVARPRAHGHAMTSTEMAKVKARLST
jgi:hypothetical protein